MQVVLVESSPGPPLRGTNEFTIRVLDGAGKPLGSAPPTVDAFMPDHGHGSSVRATVSAQPDGSFLVQPLYLFMPGVWRVTFTEDTSSVAFFFCIAG